MTEIELRTHFEKGYFAFLEYAASYWLDHLKAGLKRASDSDALTDVYNSLVDNAGLFLREYQIVEYDKLEALEGNESCLFKVISDIADEVMVRNKWALLEMRTWRVRRQMEMLAKEFQDDCDSSHANLVVEIYGDIQFRCSKLGCLHFQQGFETRSQRDKHLDRHQRPFRCLENQCPFQQLGFTDKMSLRRHLSRYHRKDDESGWSLLLPATKTKSIDLIHAAQKGDVDVVQNLISSGAFMEMKAKHSQALRVAATHGQLGICKLLMDNGFLVDSQVLHAAVRSSDIEMIQYFLSLDNVMPNLYNSQKKSTLHIAAESNADVAVKMLLNSKGVDPDAKDNRGRTPLHFAVRANNLEIVLLLLETRKVNPNAKTREGETPLSITAPFHDTMVASALLATGKVDPDSRTRLMETPLIIAAREGSKGLVQILLATDRVDLNAKNRYGTTPLIGALANGHTDIVKMILCNPRVDPNAADSVATRPLWHAIKKNDITIVKLLLLHPRINLGGADRSGKPILTKTIDEGMIEIVEILLRMGEANLNEVDTNQETPLIAAVRSRSKIMVQMLLDTGRVDVNWMSPHGITALGITKVNNDQDLFELLVAAGAKYVEPTGGGPSQQVGFSSLSPKSQNRSLQDYSMQMMLLERQNKLLKTRPEPLEPPAVHSNNDTQQKYLMEINFLEQLNKKNLILASQYNEPQASQTDVPVEDVLGGEPIFQSEQNAKEDLTEHQRQLHQLGQYNTKRLLKVKTEDDPNITFPASPEPSISSKPSVDSLSLPPWPRLKRPRLTVEAEAKAHRLAEYDLRKRYADQQAQIMRDRLDEASQNQPGDEATD